VLRSRTPPFETHRKGGQEASQGSEAAREALGELCEAYWYPLYAYLRRRGRDADEAHDLVQGFLVRLLERGDLAASPEKGRFRSYLLGALQHHVANEKRREGAKKRTPDRPLVSLSPDEAESRYVHEPANEETPERLFERRWALALIERALATLREEARERGRLALTEALLPRLVSPAEARPLRELADELGLSEGALKVAHHRLKRRLAECIRAEVLDTVAVAPTEGNAPGEPLEDELRRLFAALGSGRTEKVQDGP